MAGLVAPAIAGRADPHAWMIRGWVEAGLRESLRGEDAADGVFELSERGDLELRFASVPGEPAQVYAVTRHVDASGVASWTLCCPEALLLLSFPEWPIETVGVRVADHVRRHDAAFAAWRAQGGRVDPGERAGIRPPRGAAPPDPALVRALRALRDAGTPLSAGPTAGWWNAGAADRASAQRSVGAAIVAGEGRDPAYKLRMSEAERPENVAHAGQLRTAGNLLLAVGVTGVIFGLLAVAGAIGLGFYAGWGRIVEQPYAAAAAVAGLPAGIAQIFAGWSMRNLRRPGLSKWIALLTALPCSGACCLIGLPAGGWAWWLLRNPRTQVVCV